MKTGFIAAFLVAVICLSFTHSPFKSVRLSSDGHSTINPADSFTQNEVVETTLDAEVPCTGETVHLEGPLHILFHVTTNKNNYIIKTHFNYQHLTGVSTAGTKFHANDVSQSVEKGSFRNGQSEMTIINNFRLIGQGPKNNYVVHENVHVIFNAHRVLTADVNHLSIECK